MSEITENSPRDPGLAAHIAQYHLTRRDPEAARATLSPFLTATPETSVERQALAEAFARLAQVHLAKREANQALELVTRARTLFENAAVWQACAAVASSQGDAPLAQEWWRRVTTAEPGKSASWMGLARACEAASDRPGAVAAYLAAARAEPSHSTALSIAERLAALAPAQPDTPRERRIRIAIIGSSTLDHVRAYLEVETRQAGLSPEFYVGPFDQYAQEILDPASALYAFAPDVIIMAIHGRAFFPDLYDNPVDLTVDARRATADEIAGRMAALVAQLVSRTTALVLLHTFATPQYSPFGALDLRDNFGQTALFAAINGALAERVRHDFPSVHLVDEDRVYGRIGKRNVTDPRLWFLARIGIGEGALGALTQEYMRFIKALKGRNRKCLVLDLDNTLWGGVVGEDGPHGIALGQEAPGNAFRAFQEAILSLWKRGIILAINSKNNEADALEVLERHPDMILRPQHFAATRINWLDKVSNLESIAAELNIGLDSMVFVDDNPAECAMVRGRLPHVLTIELPRDPARYRGLLLELTDFDTLVLTEEDRQRGQLYAQRRARQEWEASRGDNLGDYLADLGLEVDVALADAFAIPRIAQLIGKTNQYNLTTRRHSEAQVQAFAASVDHVVYAVRVKDRFGDHGLVGTAIVARERDVWTVDTLLLSCRVLGRGVETAFLSALVAAAQQDGARTLRGLFAPTAKNAPARDFYRAHGFILVHEDAGTQHWELDVRVNGVTPPAWIALQGSQPALVSI